MPASIWDMWQQERSREGQPKGASTLHMTTRETAAIRSLAGQEGLGLVRKPPC